MSNLRKKKKANLMVEMNLKNSKTSFADYGAKEILKDFRNCHFLTFYRPIIGLPLNFSIYI